MRVVIGAACLVAALVIGLFVLSREHGTATPRDAAPVVSSDASTPVAAPEPPRAPADAVPVAIADAVEPAVAGDATNEVFEAFESLRNSGSANESWAPAAEQLFKSLPEMSEMGCYVAGCAVSLELPSAAVFDRRRAEIEAMPAYRAWTGGKRWTAPVPASGGVVVALILYRPD